MVLFQPKRILRVLAGFGVALFLLLPITSVGAEPYGSGSYSDCNYNQTNCPSGSSDSGGGSSAAGSNQQSGSGSDTEDDDDILLNEYDDFFTDAGQDFDLKAKQVVYFKINEDGTLQQHSVTIKEVGKDYVVIVVESEPQTDKLFIGETGKYDVNDDNKDDIAITLNSIDGKYANLSFKQLGDAPKITPQQVTPAVNEEKSSSRNWTPIILSALATVAGLVLFIWLRARGRRSPNNQ